MHECSVHYGRVITCSEVSPVKNITLSADEGLIEAARRRAAAERTTLNAEFRMWLAEYAGL